MSCAGVAWKCQILPFRVFDITETGNTSTPSLVATAIDRAVGKGAKIINMSFGGDGFSQNIADAVAGEPNTVRGANKQTAMVVSAGNDGSCSNSATQVLEPTPTPDPGSGGGGDGGIEPPIVPASVDPNAAGFPNNDTNPTYPASLSSPNLIAVANTIADALRTSY